MRAILPIFLLATLSSGCISPATGPTTKPADATVANPMAAPASLPAKDDVSNSLRRPDQTETRHAGLGNPATQTVVARGEMPLIYWPHTGEKIRVLDDTNKIIAEFTADRRAILRVAANGVFFGDDALNTASLHDGNYQIVIVAESDGEIRQEYRNRTAPQ